MGIPTNETTDAIKKLAFKAPVIAQPLVNSFIYALDKELLYCVARLYSLLPEYVSAYYSSIIVSWMRGITKRFSLYKKVHPSGITLLKEIPKNPSPERFVYLLESSKLLRGYHYTLIGNVCSSVESCVGDINKEFILRSSFRRDIPYGEILDISRRFNVARKVQESIEKPFYRKVLKVAFNISKGNQNLVQDNFMVGVEGLRKAIWRFDIMHGAILASFIEKWISNAIIEAQAHNLIHIPKNVPYVYNQINKIMEDTGKDIGEAAKKFGLTEERAKDIQTIMSCSTHIRLDDLLTGLEDDSKKKEEKELIDEDSIVMDSMTTEEKFDYILSSASELDRKVVCLYYGTWDMFPSCELSKKEILAERDRQLSAKHR